MTQVHIQLLGTRGELPKRQLVHSGSRKNGISGFKPKSTNTFHFEGKDVGDVVSVIVEVGDGDE